MKKFLLGLVFLSSVVISKAQTVLIKSTVTNAAFYNIDLSPYYTTYDYYKIYIYDLSPVTDNVNLLMNVSSTGTGSIENGAGMYNWLYNYNASTGNNSTSDVAIHLVNGQSNGAGKHFTGEFHIGGVNNSGFFPTIEGTASAQLSGTVTPYEATIMGFRTTAEICKVIQLSYSSGNIANLTIKIEGYLN